MIRMKDLWAFHPEVRSGKDGLTLGERSADKIRNGMGSWPFVFLAISFLCFWIFSNGVAGFDPFPFILLNLMLSSLAALQGAILLIAAKRSDQVSSELAQHDFQVNQESLQLLKEMHHLIKTIHDMYDMLEDHVEEEA